MFLKIENNILKFQADVTRVLIIYFTIGLSKEDRYQNLSRP